LVIIDTPGEDSPLTHNAMSAADLCLVPIRPTRADGRGNRPTVEALMRGGKRFAFVLNQCPTTPGNSRAPEMAAGLAALGLLAEPMIGSRVDYQDAYAAGKGVTEYAPAGKAADEIRQLWAWIDRETKKEKNAS
jgi:chromosome partitioning protein